MHSHQDHELIYFFYFLIEQNLRQGRVKLRKVIPEPKPETPIRKPVHVKPTETVQQLPKPKTDCDVSQYKLKLEFILDDNVN